MKINFVWSFTWMKNVSLKPWLAITKDLPQKVKHRNVNKKKHLNFWPLTTHLRGKCYCYSQSLSKSQQWGDIIGRWREYFWNILNPVTLTPSNTQDAHLGMKTTLKVGKITICDKVRPDMLKSFNKTRNSCTYSCVTLTRGLAICKGTDWLETVFWDSTVFTTSTSHALEGWRKLAKIQVVANVLQTFVMKILIVNAAKQDRSKYA